MTNVRGLLKRYANRYMVCEAPGDAIAFSAPTSCASSFAFGHNNRIVSAALGNPSAIELVSTYFTKASAGMAQFASNHDAFAGQRLMDRMQGDEARYRLAAASYLLQPGTPFVYYGEEIGMSGGAGLAGDHKLRTPMSWSARAVNAGFSTAEPFRKLAANFQTHNVEREEGDANSLLNYYRGLLALRKQRPSLRIGSYQSLLVDGWSVSYQRVTADETSVVVLNYADKVARIALKDIAQGSRLVQVWPAARVAKGELLDRKQTLLMPKLSVAVFALEAKP